MRLMILEAAERRRLLEEETEARDAARQVGGGEEWQALIRESKSRGGLRGGADAYW